MTLYFSNLAAYSVQLAALVAAALVATSLLRLRTPLPSLRLWQAVLAAGLLLPLVQPWGDDGRDVIASSLTIVSTSAPVAAITLSGVDLTRLTLVLLVAGIAARLLRLALGLVRLRTIVRRASDDPSLTALTSELARSLGAGATAMITDDLEGPATIGARRPIVLLPRRVQQMPLAVQRAIVCHELVHVKRRDWLQTIGEEILCAALWFHPAARVLASRLSLARETVVDETTILLTRDRRAYAEALLAFADPQPHVIGATPFIGRRTLSQRISLIAEEASMPRRHTFARFAAALAVAVVATAAAITLVPMSATLQAQAGKVYAPGPGITLPTVVREVKPKYTAAAMRAKIEGSVWLTCVVGESGDITEAVVSRSLDKEYGLDQAAIDAAGQWKFKPGMKDGKPIAVRITLEMTFTLRK